MKILCLSKQAIPYVNGTTVCVARLLRALMDAGHEVRLITAEHPTGRSSCLPAPGWENVGCAMRHVNAQSPSRPGPLGRWGSRIASTLSVYSVPFHQDPGWVSAAEPVLLEEIERFTPDVVVTTDPVADHLVGLRARRNHAFRWIVHFTDPWDMNTMFVKYPWFKLSYLYHRRVFSRVASLADAFTYPSKRLAVFERQFSLGPWPALVKVIPHIGTKADRAAPREPGMFRLVHVGDLRPQGRAECLLPEGLQRAMTEEPRLSDTLEMVFVGNVPEHFRGRAESCLGRAFRWIPPCPYPTSLEYIASADVNIVIERKSSHGVIWHTKLGDYAVVDAPIFTLGPKVGNMADLAREGQSLHASPDDVDEIADRVLSLYRAWEADELATYGHERLAGLCKPENGARQFEGLVRSIGGQSDSIGAKEVEVTEPECG